MKLQKINKIRAAIQQKYESVAKSPKDRFNYPVGLDGLIFLNYDREYVNKLPEQVVESFCGVGNPFSLRDIQPGEMVLDVGAGAGFDMLLASHLVGPQGKVCGIDLTPQMVEKARKNLDLVGVRHASVTEGKVEELPYADETFTTVTSNGVLNLSPLKKQAFAEIYRVLRRGGWLQFADIVLEPGSFTGDSCDLDAWSD